MNLTSTIKKLQREFSLYIKDIIVIFLIKMSSNFFQKRNSRSDPVLARKAEVALTARYESVYCKTYKYSGEARKLERLLSDKQRLMLHHARLEAQILQNLESISFMENQRKLFWHNGHFDASLKAFLGSRGWMRLWHIFISVYPAEQSMAPKSFAVKQTVSVWDSTYVQCTFMRGHSVAPGPSMCQHQARKSMWA